MANANPATSQSPWHASYPAPRTPEPASIRREDVLEMMRVGKDTGGTIRGSINLPAQSLHPEIPILLADLKSCGTAVPSSRGWGTRAVGWFCDYVADQKDEQMQSLVLLEGIKGWAGAGDEYVQWMEEYDKNFWMKGRDLKHEIVVRGHGIDRKKSMDFSGKKSML
ncbi:hypothetical protein EJ02DRAFT_505510 [Clathrospora elynae]|uniref:Uncharacterized protein n=1 Tax=Clathrospora elynae TaxID=706981 RepID=A0A6A5SFA0_9PLEO|nr:hypothetical protein EJ02DRAFT_505510 [Clathrospora elynae]